MIKTELGAICRRFSYTKEDDGAITVGNFCCGRRGGSHDRGSAPDGIGGGSGSCRLVDNGLARGGRVVDRH